MYFCQGYDYGEKVDLSKNYWNPKRKMCVATHFSDRGVPRQFLVVRIKPVRHLAKGREN